MRASGVRLPKNPSTAAGYIMSAINYVITNGVPPAPVGRPLLGGPSGVRTGGAGPSGVRTAAP